MAPGNGQGWGVFGLIAALCIVSVLAIGISVERWTRAASLPPAASDGSARGGQGRQGGSNHERAAEGGAPAGPDQNAGYRKRDAEKRNELDWPNWIQAGSAAASLLVSLALLFVTRKQADIARRQERIAGGTLQETAAAAEAAKASAEASRLALVHGREVFLSTERPWISVQAIPVRLFYNESGCNLNVLFILKNVGKSPATDVFVDAAFTGPVFSADAAFEPDATQRRVSDEARGRPPRVFGEVIFPGDQSVFNYTFSIGKAALDSMLKHAEVIHPLLIGCVGYGFVFEPGNHQTGFIYDVRRSDRPRPESRAKNRSETAIFPDEGDIAQDDLLLVRSFRGFYAD